MIPESTLTALNKECKTKIANYIGNECAKWASGDILNAAYVTTLANINPLLPHPTLQIITL